MTRKFVISLLAGCFLLFNSCDNNKKKQIVIASVGNEKLTLKEILEDIPVEIKKNLTTADVKEYVQKWINSQVLYQEAKRRNLDDDPNLKKEFKKVKRELLVDRLIELELKNDVSVTDEEIEKYYEEHKDDFILTEDQVHAYHILVKSRKEANNVRKKLRKGEDFENVAKEIYGDSVKKNEWDLGYFTRSEIIPEIANKVFDMPVGSISLPIKSEFGYHIIKVIDKQKKGTYNKLENVREEIKFKLEALKKRAQYQRLLIQVRNKTPVETYFDILNKVKLDSLIHRDTP